MNDSHEYGFRMAKSWILNCLAVSFICLSAPSCTSDPELKLRALGQADTVMAFGDSLTAGFGLKKSEAYPAVLEKLIGRVVANEGVSGDTSSGGKARIVEALTRNRPKLVILCLGGNDFLRRQDKAQTKANLAEIINRSRAYGVEVVLVAVPTPGLFLSPHKLFKELSKELKVPLLEDELADLLSDASMRHDNIHLNARGYRELALSLRDLLKDTGAIK